nr:unnamed protein product [Callosobruchus analis]
MSSASSSRRSCVNQPDVFCYICGEYMFQQNRRAITEFVKQAYLAYFGVKLGDQDKTWAPHLVLSNYPWKYKYLFLKELLKIEGYSPCLHPDEQLSLAERGLGLFEDLHAFKAPETGNLPISTKMIEGRLLSNKYTKLGAAWRYIPSKSIAYTGRALDKASKLRHHNATPAPRPCKSTRGVFGDSVFNEIVHILSELPTTGPMSTKNPLCGVLTTEKKL